VPFSTCFSVPLAGFSAPEGSAHPICVDWLAPWLSRRTVDAYLRASCAVQTDVKSGPLFASVTQVGIIVAGLDWGLIPGMVTSGARLHANAAVLRGAVVYARHHRMEKMRFGAALPH